MEFWNSILHTALLGTDKKQLNPEDLAPDLRDISEQIGKSTEDKEDRFLQIAAVAFNYRQAGITPFYKEGITLSQSPAEEKKYCSPAATAVSKEILAEENLPLLKFWLQLCQTKGLLITPEWLPVLLQKGVSQKTIRPFLADCGGKRAQWLTEFNPEWKFSTTESDEMMWETGTPDQRKQVLTSLRQKEPDKAREWLQETWSKEDANTKADLLSILAIQAGEKDLIFLETLLTEKSKKVKEEVMALLKTIPGSSVVSAYWNILEQTFGVITEKGFLGLTKHTLLQISFPQTIEDAIFKSGIEKLSNVKAFTDEEFIIYQLIGFTPPSFWETHFSSGVEEILSLFHKKKETGKFIPAFEKAAGTFGNRIWAKALIKDESRFYYDLLHLLDKEERDSYLLRNIGRVAERVIPILASYEEEWSLDLTREILKLGSGDPYRVSRQFFNQQIHLIPTGVLPAISGFTATGEHHATQWNNTRDNLSKLLSLKQDTINAFNE